MSYKRIKKFNIFKSQYIVTETMEFQTLVCLKEASIIRRPDGKILARLERSGKMTVFPEYQWDGPSGPTIDSHAFIMGSCPHDVLYQMLRENLLINQYLYNGHLDEMYREFCRLRKWADDTMKVINKLHGMSSFRAWYTYESVRLFGEKHAMPEILKND